MMEIDPLLACLAHQLHCLAVMARARPGVGYFQKNMV